MMFELTIKKNFNVSVEQLFKAWCQPELIQRWFAPGNMTVPEAYADVKEGGFYRIVMRDAEEGCDHIVGGEYQKVVENETLIFTWQWEGNPIATKVKIGFKVISENVSELILIHSEIDDQASCDKHQMGWNGCLHNLPNALQ